MTEPILPVFDVRPHMATGYVNERSKLNFFIFGQRYQKNMELFYIAIFRRFHVK